MPACRRCHKLKDYRDLASWPPAALTSAANGMGATARILICLLAAAKDDPEFDTSIDRDNALRALDDCRTAEARIFVGRSIAFALDETKRRKEASA